MFTQPQRLRRFAVHVLLVWLFALGTGIANACIVQLHWQHGVPSVAAHVHQHMVAAADQDHAADIHASQGQLCHDSIHRTPPPCERLCDGPSAVPQAERQPLDLLSGFWLVPAPVPSFEFQSFEAGRIVASEPIPWHQPVPIAISFLRLAL